MLLHRFMSGLLLSVALTALAQPAPIRVGYIAPLTGPTSDLGGSGRMGLELAVAEINQAGGFLGQPIQLVIRDDKGVPDEGFRHAKELVEVEKVRFTIGGGSSGVTLRMLEVFQQNAHVLMVGMATATAITTKYPAPSSFVFRMAASDSLQASFLVDEVVRNGYSRVALLADKTGYGEGGTKDIEKFLAARDLKPVYIGRFEVGVPSLAQEVAQAKAKGADVIISYTVGTEQALIAKARADGKISTPQFAPWTGASRVVWEKGGKAVNGLVVVQTMIKNQSNERNTSFRARLAKHAAGTPVLSLMSAAQHYDAMHLMLRAMFQTKGDTSGKALKHALETLPRPYVGALTTHEHPFSSADHEAFTKNMTWLGVWKDGEIEFLHAEDARRASYVRRKESGDQKN